MKILVIGGTGTVGSEVLKELVARDSDVRALVRKKSRADLPKGVEVVEGDLTEPSQYARHSRVSTKVLLKKQRILDAVLSEHAVS